MSYTIRKSDGTTLASVPENGIVLNASSVALIGRGATHYGVLHSEAFVHILENFAHTSPPEHPLEGQLWFDKTVGILKIYKGGVWIPVGGGGGGGSGSNVGGPIFVAIGNSSLIANVAGGKVVSVISPRNFANTELPVSLTVMEQVIPFRARFPFGVEAGHTLATDSDDYIYSGHVPNADAAIWTGGGGPFGCTTFCDIGPTTVLLSISNESIVSATSRVAVPNGNLPTNFVVNNISMPFRSIFPSGLVAGLTFASNFGIGLGGGTISGGNINGNGNGITLKVVSDLISAESAARATAINEIYTFADNTYAEAGIVNTLTSQFLSGTGQSSLASAIDFLITTAGEGTANATAGTTLRAEIKNAITGASSFANALQILNTKVQTDFATASDLTTLQSGVTNAYTTAIATATQNMVTTSTLNSALSSFTTTLNSNFETATGYASVADAVNDLKTGSNGSGSTAAFDTDLRTRFTNAMKIGANPGTIQTVSQAMAKLSDFSTAITGNTQDFTNLVNVIKGLPGNNLQQSTSSAVQNLVSNSFLDSSLATFKTTLTSEYVEAMNEVTGGAGTTYAAAIADIVATTSSNASGSTSSIDTALRNIFINNTHESLFPVTTVTQAIQKLMNGSFADRALSTQITELQAVFTNGLGVSLATATSKLTTIASDALAGATGVTQLQSKLVNETGQANWSAAIDYLATQATKTSTNASRISSIESTFTTTTGQQNFASAISTLWTRATAAGSIAGYALELNSQGKIAGLQLVADGAMRKSEIVIRADNFKFWHPDTPDIIPFEIVNNEVRIRNLLIGNQSLGFEKLQQTTFTSEVYMGSYGMPSGQVAIYNGAMSVSTGNVPAGSKIVIFFSSNVTGSDSGGMFANVRRNDGAFCQGTAEFGNPDEGGSAQHWVWSDTIPSQGNWTYTVWGTRFGSCTIRNAHLIGLVQKQLGAVTSGVSMDQPPVGGGGYFDDGSGGFTDFGFGSCVDANSYMPDGRFASEYAAGDELLVLDYSTMERAIAGQVNYVRLQRQPTVKLTSSSGIWVVVSTTTPLTLRDGSVVYTYDVLNKQLAVQDDDGFRWEDIVTVEDAGERYVALIAADNQTYAAGGARGRYIFTHNLDVIKF